MLLSWVFIVRITIRVYITVGLIVHINGTLIVNVAKLSCKLNQLTRTSNTEYLLS